MIARAWDRDRDLRQVYRIDDYPEVTEQLAELGLKSVYPRRPVAQTISYYYLEKEAEDMAALRRAQYMIASWIVSITTSLSAFLVSVLVV